MRNLLFVLGTTLVLASCGSGTGTTTNVDTTTVAKPAATPVKKDTVKAAVVPTTTVSTVKK